MNLHAIASGAVAAVNPFIAAIWKQNAGTYTTAADGTRTPAYQPDQAISLQVQALTARDIEHLDSLNIQNVTRKAWANGNVQAANRATGQGGDLIVFNGLTWLVSIVFETWDADGWCSVGLTLQNGS